MRLRAPRAPSQGRRGRERWLEGGSGAGSAGQGGGGSPEVLCGCRGGSIAAAMPPARHPSPPEKSLSSATNTSQRLSAVTEGIPALRLSACQGALVRCWVLHEPCDGGLGAAGGARGLGAALNWALAVAMLGLKPSSTTADLGAGGSCWEVQRVLPIEAWADVERRKKGTQSLTSRPIARLSASSRMVVSQGVACLRPTGGRAALPAARGSRATAAPRAAVLVRASGCWGETDSDAQLATGRRQALAAGGALLSSLLLPGAGSGFGAADAAEPAAVESIYDLSAMQYGEEVPLSKYRGQVRCPCALSWTCC